MPSTSRFEVVFVDSVQIPRKAGESGSLRADRCGRSNGRAKMRCRAPLLRDCSRGCAVTLRDASGGVVASPQHSQHRASRVAFGLWARDHHRDDLVMAVVAFQLRGKDVMQLSTPKPDSFLGCRNAARFDVAASRPRRERPALPATMGNPRNVDKASFRCASRYVRANSRATKDDCALARDRRGR